MSADELAFLTAAEQGRLIERGELSPVDLTRAYLERIERWNPSLNAFITVNGERALAASQRAPPRPAARDPLRCEGPDVDRGGQDDGGLPHPGRSRARPRRQRHQAPE